MSSAQAALGSQQGIITNLPQPGVARALITSGTLTAAFQDNISTVVSVRDAREVVLLVKHTPDAAQSGGIVNLLVAFAYCRDAPAQGDDSWYLPTVQTALSQGALPGTVPTGADYSAASDHEPQEARRAYYALEAADATEAVRDAVVVPCAGARWMYVACSQSVDTTNFGTVAVDYVLNV